MAKFRAGPTYTQEILSEFINAVESFGNTEEHPDIAFKYVTQALQKFLHYGMSRFSVDTLQSVLDDLIVSNTGEEQKPFNIRSLTQLRTVVKMNMMKRDAGSLKASDANALKFIETFFYCVYCLSEAKRMFDKIYENLYFAYLEPNGVSRQSTKVPSAQPKGREQKHDNKLLDVEDYSQFGISTLQQMTGSTQHKLRQTARDMKEVLDRWTDILTDEEPNVGSFDPESEEDLHLLHGVSGSETILRLVPDLFAKYYKCMELTKQWWVLAHDAYPDVPFRRRPSQDDTTDAEIDFSRSSSSGGDTESLQSDKTDEVTNDEIEEVKVIVIENQKVINSLQEEIEALEKREEKFEILKETYDKVGKEIEQKKKEQKRLRIDRDRLNPDENKDTLVVIGENIETLDSSIRLLEFQHALLFEDFMIHLEIRPSIIRFQDDAKSHLKEAQITREKHMTQLQKLRDSHSQSLTQTKGDAVWSKKDTSKRKISLPAITHSKTSPENGVKAPSPALSEGRGVKEKMRSRKVGTFTVDENKKLHEKFRRNNKEQKIEEHAAKETRPKDGANSKKENLARPRQIKNEIEKSETISTDVEIKEKKSNILKRANDKQNVEAVNLVQNVSLKTVSKRGVAEHMQVTVNENLRRTYDLSNKNSRLNPKENQESEPSKVAQPSSKNDHTKKKTSVTEMQSNAKASESENRSDGQQDSRSHSRRNLHQHTKKVNSDQAPPPKGDNPIKTDDRKPKEEPVLNARRPSKKLTAPASTALPVKSK